MPDRDKPMHKRPRVWIYEDLVGAFNSGRLKMCVHKLGFSRGEFYEPVARRRALEERIGSAVVRLAGPLGRARVRAEQIEDLGERAEQIRDLNLVVDEVTELRAALRSRALGEPVRR